MTETRNVGQVKKPKHLCVVCGKKVYAEEGEYHVALMQIKQRRPLRVAFWCYTCIHALDVYEALVEQRRTAFFESVTVFMGDSGILKLETPSLDAPRKDML